MPPLPIPLVDVMEDEDLRVTGRDRHAARWPDDTVATLIAQARSYQT